MRLKKQKNGTEREKCEATTNRIRKVAEGRSYERGKERNSDLPYRIYKGFCFTKHKHEFPESPTSVFRV